MNQFHRISVILTGIAATGLVLPDSASLSAQTLSSAALASLPTVEPAPPPDETQSLPFREEAYTLGVGDQIQVDIFGVPEFSGNNGRYVILVDGTVSLPWAGRIDLNGLTLEEASNSIASAYDPYIHKPRVSVRLLSTRALRVSVAGEVNRPGSYIVNPGNSGSSESSNSQWPTLTQAIQNAGGITATADLRQIQVIRAGSGGAEKTLTINLWELLKTGELIQDVTLRDGDRIVVPKAIALSNEEALTIGSASFAPENIRVNVVGEVVRPGTVELQPNTPLNQAILTSGGFDNRRASRGEVELIRLNSDGTASRRTIQVDLASGINQETNPALRSGDTVVVKRSGFTKVGDTLGKVFDPFFRALGIFNIFFR
jgi:polysaccharide biosynthesis/export protein